MKIALTGDVMLGRLINRYMVDNIALSPETVWGDVVPLFSSADCRLINLECVISTRGSPWNPSRKPFHFRANPRAINLLQSALIDCATLANNHILDYGPEALLDCLEYLDQADIQHTGAGATMGEALAPAFLEHSSGRIAVVALTDNEPEWEATQSLPGVNYARYDSRGLLPPYRNRIAEAIRHARERASFVIISAHVGPNWGDPSSAMRTLARQLLDLGADVYWGHSNHTPQGIEIYRGKVVLYSTGDFIDDYAVDPEERNDLSFLFVLEEDAGTVNRLQLYPVRIEQFQVHRAMGSAKAFLQDSFQKKCRQFGTHVMFHHEVGTIAVN